MIPEYENPSLDRIGLKNKKQVTQEKQGTGSDPFRRNPPGKWLNPEKIKVCSMILGLYVFCPQEKKLKEWALFLARTAVRPSTLEQASE